MVSFKKSLDIPIVDQNDIAMFVEYDTGYNREVVLNVIDNFMLILAENSVKGKKTIVPYTARFLPRTIPNTEAKIFYHDGEKCRMAKVKRKSHVIYYKALPQSFSQSSEVL